MFCSLLSPSASEDNIQMLREEIRRLEAGEKSGTEIRAISALRKRLSSLVSQRNTERELRSVLNDPGKDLRNAARHAINSR